MSFQFEQFQAWRRAIDFCDVVFQLAEGLPQRVQFSLGEQIRRAALSVPTNLAEGTGRSNTKERIYFYTVAKGSIYETVSLLEVAKRRSLISNETHASLYNEANELAAMIHGAIQSNRSRL